MMTNHLENIKEFVVCMVSDDWNVFDPRRRHHKECQLAFSDDLKLCFMRKCIDVSFGRLAASTDLYTLCELICKSLQRLTVIVFISPSVE